LEISIAAIPSTATLSFYEFAFVNFVFHMKLLLGFAIFPMLLGDKAMDLAETLGRERVRAKISGETLYCEFGQFFFGTFGVNDEFIRELG
jgi:hypothetical protein